MHQCAYNHSSLQVEAARLKKTAKVITVGIGSGISELEFNNIASAPQDKTVIRVQDFSGLTGVKDSLISVSCSGQ